MAGFGGGRWWWSLSQHGVHLAILGGGEGDGGLLVTEGPTGACPALQSIAFIHCHGDGHRLAVGDGLGVGNASSRIDRGGDDAVDGWGWSLSQHRVHLAILGGGEGDGGLLVTEGPTGARPFTQGIALIHRHGDGHRLAVGDGLGVGNAPSRIDRGGDDAVDGWGRDRPQHGIHLAILGGGEGDGGLLVTEGPTGACPAFQSIAFIHRHGDGHRLAVGDGLGVGNAPAGIDRGGDDAVHRRWGWQSRQHGMHLAILGGGEGDGGLLVTEGPTGACPAFQSIAFIHRDGDGHRLAVGDGLGVGNAPAGIDRGGDDAIGDGIGTRIVDGNLLAIAIFGGRGWWRTRIIDGNLLTITVFGRRGGLRAVLVDGDLLAITIFSRGGGLRTVLVDGDLLAITVFGGRGGLRTVLVDGDLLAIAIFGGRGGLRTVLVDGDLLAIAIFGGRGWWRTRISDGDLLSVAVFGGGHGWWIHRIDGIDRVHRIGIDRINRVHRVNGIHGVHRVFFYFLKHRLDGTILGGWKGDGGGTRWERPTIPGPLLEFIARFQGEGNGHPLAVFDGLAFGNASTGAHRRGDGALGFPKDRSDGTRTNDRE